MRTDWLKTRQTRYTAYASAYILVIIAVLAAANFLAQRHNKSVDTTSNKRFSLSDQTQKVVKGLKQDVKVTYFDRTSSFGSARDLLDRYDNLSPKLYVEYVDPDKKPQIAKAAGVRNYGTVFVETGGKKEEAKSVTEEELTGAIVRALKGGVRNVCFVSGSGEHGIDDSGRSGFSSVKDALERNNYKTRTISLLGAENPAPPADSKAAAPPAPKAPEVPSDCTVLIVAGPKYDYPPPEINAIKNYVENGGRALLLLDPPLSLRRQETTGNEPLSKLLESWGVTLNKDLVLDASGVGQIFGLGPEVPLVTSYESHQIVREMKEIATALPLARTLDVKNADKTSVEKLFSTSGNSYATTNLASPEIRLDPKKDKKGPFALAAAGTYSGKDNKQGRFVVVGSSLFAANNILRFNGNRDLFLNMVSWLSSDEDLISIRPKEPEDRRLNLSRRQMSMLFWSSVVFLPLIVVVSGLAVWWRRR